MPFTVLSHPYVVLSIWYMRKEYARRAGLFFSFSSLAGAFGGLLAYA